MNDIDRERFVRRIEEMSVKAKSLIAQLNDNGVTPFCNVGLIDDIVDNDDGNTVESVHRQLLAVEARLLTQLNALYRLRVTSSGLNAARGLTPHTRKTSSTFGSFLRNLASRPVLILILSVAAGLVENLKRWRNP